MNIMLCTTREVKLTNILDTHQPHNDDRDNGDEAEPLAPRYTF
jgi:hypothetical protein